MAMVPAMTLALEASFASVAQWPQDFIARARAPGRSDGVLLDAAIVRGADTSRLERTPQSAGLYAISS